MEIMNLNLFSSNFLLLELLESLHWNQIPQTVSCCQQCSLIGICTKIIEENEGIKKKSCAAFQFKHYEPSWKYFSAALRNMSVTVGTKTTPPARMW